MNNAEHSNDKKPVFEKKTGFSHAIAATRYSMQGLKRLTQEAAFRHELIAFAVIIILLAALSAPIEFYLVSLILMLLLMCVEALNTAIEEIVDYVSPEFSIAAKNAKDLGSLAVLLLVISNAAFLVYAVAKLLFFN